MRLERHPVTEVARLLVEGGHVTRETLKDAIGIREPREHRIPTVGIIPKTLQTLLERNHSLYVNRIGEYQYIEPTFPEHTFRDSVEQEIQDHVKRGHLDIHALHEELKRQLPPQEGSKPRAGKK